MMPWGVITTCIITIVAGDVSAGVEAAKPAPELVQQTAEVAQLLADSSGPPASQYAQRPGPPGGTGGVIPPGGRLPGGNGRERTPEGTNPGPLPPGSNGGPPPKEKDEMPKELNPQNDPDVNKGWEKHQKEHGK